MRNRQELIDSFADRGTSETPVGLAFLQAEGTAERYTEYIADAVPTFLQLPELSAAYMRGFFGDRISDDQIDYGIEARRIRTEDAAQRKNTLYITEESLAMDSLFTLPGNPGLGLSEAFRARQITHIIEKAQEPHIDLYFVGKGDHAFVGITNAMLMEGPDGTKAVFQEEDSGLRGPINDQARATSIIQNLAVLSYFAIGAERSLNAIRNFE